MFIFILINGIMNYWTFLYERSVYSSKMFKEQINDLQSNDLNPIDPTYIADIEYENIIGHTKPILHQNSRFIFVAEGSGQIRVNNSEFPLEKYSLISVAPWMTTEITEVREKIIIYIFKYSFDLFKRNLFDLYENRDMINYISRALYENNVSHNQKGLIHSFRKAFEISCNIDNIPKNIINSLYLSYLLEIASFHSLYFENNTIDLKTKPEIINYIYNNSDKKITLNELSKVFFMSNSNISRYIYKQTNLTFSELLNEIRITKATELLIHTNLNISEISTILGFSNKSHFIKSFKNLKDMTPTQFRSLYKGKKIKNDELLNASIVEYIYSNCTNNLTLSEVSIEFNMSPVQINKNLKMIVGKTFAELLNYARINKACKIMLSTDESITNIAFDVGYNTFKTFYRNFVKIKKFTPKEFRSTIEMEKNKEN